MRCLKAGMIRPFKIIFFALLLSACGNDKSEHIIQLGQNIHHDDFEYAATNIERLKQISTGHDSLIAKGRFYVVNFRVINNAKRVNHKWNNSIAYIIDASGKEYENILNAQILLNSVQNFNWQKEYQTLAQAIDSTKLIFDLPANVQKPYLMVRGKTLMGDFFDGGKFRRTKIQLFK